MDRLNFALTLAVIGIIWCGMGGLHSRLNNLEKRKDQKHG